MGKNCGILIVGLTLAALLRQRGFRPQIVESHPTTVE
jgi:2-polyprenyl-6-methoxyphenol hydroxylase-like FAD-dependent oxidoreductase